MPRRHNNRVWVIPLAPPAVRAVSRRFRPKSGRCSLATYRADNDAGEVGQVVNVAGENVSYPFG
jgi:hypothetical protein